MSTAFDTRANALDTTLVNVTSATSIEDVLDAADLNFEVRLQELSSQVVTSDGVTTVQYAEAGVVRMDSLTSLGVVGERYTPIQNRDAFAPLQYLHDEGFIESFEQAGHLGNGKRVFVIAKMAKGVNVTDADPHSGRILFSTSHDGSGAYQVRALINRLFCANQIPRINKLGKRMLTIKHTASATRRVESVRHAVLAELNWFDEYSEDYSRMLESPVTHPATEMSFINQIAPLPNPFNATDRQMRAALKKQEDIGQRIHSSANHNIKGTVAALFQGAVEYSDFDARGKNGERILLGRDVAFKSLAWETALSLV